MRKDDPDAWISSIFFTSPFALMALVATFFDLSFLFFSVPLGLLVTYQGHRARLAMRDELILRAQKLAGGKDKTTLRTRLQILAEREARQTELYEAEMTRRALALLANAKQEGE